MKPRVRAQLHSSSGRSSKLLKDPEGNEDPSRDLLAVGVVRAEGIVAIHFHPSAWKINSAKFTAVLIESLAHSKVRLPHFASSP
jgi:hypothetical protein